jgi:transmembrane sensor
MNQSLIHKYLKGEALEHEKLEMLEWIEANQENRKEFMRYRRLYDSAIWSENVDKSVNKEAQTQKRSLTLRFVREFSKVAAVIAIAVTTTLFIQKLNQNKNPVLSQTIEVPQGQYVHLTLSDGTRVSLNSNSKLIFPTAFSNDNRVVELDGEGYFEVAHNARKPFLVRTHKCDIKVLGTKFNVLAYKESKIFETSLVQGSVEVMNIESYEKQLLNPNEKVVLSNNQLLVSKMNNTDELLWRKGILVFENESLTEIFDKLTFYYDIHIVVNNKYLLEKTCTAKFRQKDGIDHIMRVLQKLHGFDFERNDSKNEILIR